MNSSIRFRPLSRSDFPTVVGWLREPHVAEWWNVSASIEGVEREFGACVDGVDPTRLFVILTGGRPVGVIQTYRLDDNPDYAAAVSVQRAAGVDLFVGDPTVIGGGFGSTVLRSFLDEVVWPAYPDLTSCIAGPSVNNLRSQRAFEKAGFVKQGIVSIPGEDDDEMIMVASRPEQLTPGNEVSRRPEPP